MRAALFALLLIGGAAWADETPAGQSSVIVRPIVGLGGSVSDSGFGLGAQVGLRVSPVILRLTLDAGGSNGPHGYVSGAVRAGWLVPLGGGALLLGAGWGVLTYGFIYDNPSDSVNTLLPEVGFIVGPDRPLGRIVVGLTGFIPLQSRPPKSDYLGQQIGPPHAMLTVTLSL